MVYTTVQFFNMVFVAERLRRKFVALVYAGSNPVEHPKTLKENIMAKVLGKNVVKCYRCSQYIEYGASDIEEKECSYGVQSYAGETYMGKFITCPSCGSKIEVD